MAQAKAFGRVRRAAGHRDARRGRGARRGGDAAGKRLLAEEPLRHRVGVCGDGPASGGSVAVLALIVAG